MIDLVLGTSFEKKPIRTNWAFLEIRLSLPNFFELIKNWKIFEKKIKPGFKNWFKLVFQTWFDQNSSFKLKIESKTNTFFMNSFTSTLRPRFLVHEPRSNFSCLIYFKRGYFTKNTIWYNSKGGNPKFWVLQLPLRPVWF